jgi:hypothetical protein
VDGGKISDDDRHRGFWFRIDTEKSEPDHSRFLPFS